MAQKKKSFMNAAMQFITMPAEAEQEPTTTTPAPVQAQEAQAGTPPHGYKTNPLYVETKSRRVQLLIRPSLHAKVKARAQEDKRSFNDMVNLLLEECLDGSRQERH